MKDYRPIWKELAKKQAFDCVDVQQYCILKAMQAKSPDKVGLAVALLQAAFSPIKNPIKLNNGYSSYSALHSLFGIRKHNSTRPLNQCLESLEEKKEYSRIREAALVILGKELKEYHAFFVVRQDISKEQQMVQFGHVAAVMAYAIGLEHSIDDDIKEHLDLKYPDDVRIHELNFVVCGVKNKEAVEGAADYIYSCGYVVHKFYEPDLNNEITAVASGPIPSYKRHWMKRYKLLKFK